VREAGIGVAFILFGTGSLFARVERRKDHCTDVDNERDSIKLIQITGFTIRITK
jgi:hypothetical protein